MYSRRQIPILNTFYLPQYSYQSNNNISSFHPPQYAYKHSATKKEQPSSNCFTKCVKTLLLVVSCLGDQISDLLYIYTNWDSFASTDLRNASIAFVTIPFILNFFISLYLLSKAKGLNQAMKGRCSQLFTLSFICCCWWIPCSLVICFLLWTKILDILEHFSYIEQMFEDGKKEINVLIKISALTQVFLEDLPQIIIQSVNNTQTNQWELMEYISLGFSILMICISTISFIFCPQKKQNGERDSQRFSD